MKPGERLQDLTWEELVARLREALSSPTRIWCEAEPGPEDLEHWTAAEVRKDALLQELQSRDGGPNPTPADLPSITDGEDPEFWKRRGRVAALWLEVRNQRS